MPMINLTDPITLLIAVVLFVLVLWFSYQSKKSVIPGIMLFVFISIIILHTLELTIGSLTAEGVSVTIRSIVMDLIFILLSFISYLWIDNVEAKLKKKKVIDHSLDWFWSKI